MTARVITMQGRSTPRRQMRCGHQARKTVEAILPPDIRPMINRLRRYPTFQGMAVHDVETRPYVVDDDGRMWMLDGSGEVA